MAANWTPANLTFQISTDGTFYNDLFRPDGEEVMMNMEPGAAVVVGHLGEYLKAIAHLKIRSGSRDHPVVQKEKRDFAVTIDDGGVVSAQKR
jgi:hypothetical protein